MRCYKFRLYPTGKQTVKLLQTLELCRQTYNALVHELNRQKVVDKAMLQALLPDMKICDPRLKEVHSKTLQYECYRLFSNLKGLSGSKKSGNKVGSLRFKGKRWFKTFNYNQTGFKFIKTGKRHDRLRLSKIGNIAIRAHREVEGTIKHIVIKKSVDKWYANIITDVEYKIEKGDKKLGIDMGVLSFLVDSDGNKVDNPLYLNKSLDKLKKAHKDLSRTKKGSKNRRKAADKLLKVHEKINNQKTDFFHKQTTKLINTCSLIAIEKLNIKSMTDTTKQKYYNMRNILDSSWSRFISMLKFKAESAGTKIIEVNPRNTSRKCSGCGSVQNMPTSQREYHCSCGLSLDRDHNSAINILASASVRGFVEDCVSGSVKQEAPCV